jgi:Response regulator containing CheY-like receiver, AAA-type ATPase, and DNA-binding domains
MQSYKKSTLKSTCSETSKVKTLARKLLAEIENLEHEQLPKTHLPVSFYEEVKRFEIELITRALVCSHGHQLEAARMLNLNPSTLNAKIKQYNIHVNSFSIDIDAPKNGKHLIRA